MVINITSHARQRIAQRGLNPLSVRKVVEQSRGLLSRKKVEISSGECHVVANLQNGTPTIITAWGKSVINDYHRRKKARNRDLLKKRRAQ